MRMRSSASSTSRGGSAALAIRHRRAARVKGRFRGADAIGSCRTGGGEHIMADETQRIDLATIIGLGMQLKPVLTMWHEIGGHAAACAVLGGHVATIGAFY